jgi:hypothetical protein
LSRVGRCGEVQSRVVVKKGGKNGRDKKKLKMADEESLGAEGRCWVLCNGFGFQLRTDFI